MNAPAEKGHNAPCSNRDFDFFYRGLEREELLAQKCDDCGAVHDVLVDTSGKHDLAALRSYQDWYLRNQLRSVRGVADVARLLHAVHAGPAPKGLRLLHHSAAAALARADEVIADVPVRSERDRVIAHRPTNAMGDRPVDRPALVHTDCGPNLLPEGVRLLDLRFPLPERFADQIQPGTFEYAVNWLVDHEIDLSVFDARYRNDETGASAYHPSVLLKVVLLVKRLLDEFTSTDSLPSRPRKKP